MKLRLCMRVIKCSFILGFIGSFLLMPGTFGLTYAKSEAPSISAQSAALIDVESGRILYSKNGDQRMRVASLTKIMTAIVAIEATDNLDKKTTVPDYAEGTEGSSIYLRKGEALTLRQLLYGLMLRSGNDAAVTIADTVGGSLEGFVFMMNKKAEYLGLNHTHFMNPHGLDDSDNHYSTANDFARLTAYALKNPIFQEIVATKVKKIPFEGEKWGRTLYNKNKMLRYYKGADGVKTGYTRKAGRCLASSATREGRQLAVITLNDPNDWKDHMILLDYGFEQFEPIKIVKKYGKVDEIEFKDATVDVIAAHSFIYPLSEEEKGTITYDMIWNVNKKELAKKRVSSFPDHKAAGFLKIKLKGEEIGSIPLIIENIQSTHLERNVQSFISLFWKTLVGFGGR